MRRSLLVAGPETEFKLALNFTVTVNHEFNFAALSVAFTFRSLHLLVPQVVQWNHVTSISLGSGNDGTKFHASLLLSHQEVQMSVKDLPSRCPFLPLRLKWAEAERADLPKAKRQFVINHTLFDCSSLIPLS